jgi:DNA invertase Pin-like site-specific DNA recombinase
MSEMIPVAQYVRMSTEHQQYSIDNQADAIRRYATAHNFEIVRTYADPGRSGVVLKNRPGLGQLLKGSRRWRSAVQGHSGL